LADVEERDIQTPWGVPAAEYRGREENGTYWREVLIPGESIGYDKATSAAAAHFDAIIDSLCFKVAPEGPQDRIKMAEFMRRHGLTPAP
jgi:hypothetical protein